jgi:predicted RNase H-like nuclease (RuvC/YqgF family)
MTIHLSITIPVYKKDCWDRTERNGKLEVSSDVDSLSEGYEALKQQLDKLLAELDAQNRLAENALALDNQIQQKAYTLKRLTDDIERATRHYNDLKLLLEGLGIDPRRSRLTFDKELLLNAASVAEVEIVTSKLGDEF